MNLKKYRICIVLFVALFLVLSAVFFFYGAKGKNLSRDGVLVWNGCKKECTLS